MFKFIAKMLLKIKLSIVKFLRRKFLRIFPEMMDFLPLADKEFLSEPQKNLWIGKSVKIYAPSHLYNCTIGDYSYVSLNSYISHTTIGKFCSIGPNLVCGWGIHPLNGISTAPMFYSSMKQNGMTLSKENKIEERKPIVIGNDVFIGANVTILDGVTIGDGAVIGAGAVVSKDIPPYAVAVGVPIRILRYRFTSRQMAALNAIKWWDWKDEKLVEVEKMFYDIDKFIENNASFDNNDKL